MTAKWPKPFRQELTFRPTKTDYGEFAPFVRALSTIPSGERSPSRSVAKKRAAKAARKATRMNKK